MKKKKQFYIPGVYHKLAVKTVSKKWMKKKFNSKSDKDHNVLAYYEHLEGEIYLGRELTPEVRLHTLFHEISHHILDTLDDVKDEETRCDLLGSYLMRLVEEKENILKCLSDENSQEN